MNHGSQASGKPWLHSPSGYWCVTLDGKREYLDKDYQVAGRKLKADSLPAGSENWRAAASGLTSRSLFWPTSTWPISRPGRSRPPISLSGTVYSEHWKILALARVAEIRKLHLAKIEQSLTRAKYSSTTVKHTIAAVQGVFHWAVKHEVLDGNPLVGYEKPKAHRRTRVITPEEYGKLLAKVDANFGRVITALRMTGCRPGEDPNQNCPDPVNLVAMRARIVFLNATGKSGHHDTVIAKSRDKRPLGLDGDSGYCTLKAVDLTDVKRLTSNC